MKIESSEVTNNGGEGIVVSDSSIVGIGDEAGTSGDVTITGNSGNGIEILENSFAEITNTTISGNGRKNALQVVASSVSLFGGNSFTHDGSTEPFACVVAVAGPAAVFGRSTGAPDSFTLVNGDPDDAALCTFGPSHFAHNNVTIDGGGGSGLSFQAFGSSRIVLAETDFATLDTGTIVVNGPVLMIGHSTLFVDGATINGDIGAFNNTLIDLFGINAPNTVNGGVALFQKAELNISFSDDITGTVTCNHYAMANDNTGGISGSFADATFADAGCGP